MAHIRKRGDHYQARYRAGDGRERTKTFKRKTDAEKWVTTEEAKQITGDWVDPRRAKMPFGDWAGEWFDARTGLSPKTRAVYASYIKTRLLPTFGTRQLGRIRPIDVQKWIADFEQRLAASSIRPTYVLFRQIMQAAVDNGLISRSPCVRIALPKIVIRDDDMPVLSPEEIERLADAIAPRFRAFVFVAAYGGLRFGELAALKRGRVDVATPALRVVESATDVEGQIVWGPPKSNRMRRVALPIFMRQVLAQHFADYVEPGADAIVFADSNGGPLRNSNFRNHVFNPAVEAAGVPRVTPHGLRHSCASMLIGAGAQVKAVQKHLGHASASITLDRYSHLFPDAMDAPLDALNSLRPEQSGPRLVAVPADKPRTSG